MGWTTEKDPRQGSLLGASKGGATEEDWPKRPSDCQLQEAGKDSDWAIAPVAKAACVPAHLAPPGSPQAKQPCHLHANSHWGRAATGTESLATMHAGSLQ